MIDATRSSGPCANAPCTRPAEPGEDYCGECGLERSLYRRDTRRPSETGSAQAQPRPERR